MRSRHTAQDDRVTAAFLEYVNNSGAPPASCAARLADLLNERGSPDQSGLGAIEGPLGRRRERSLEETISEVDYRDCQSVPFFRGRIFRLGIGETFLLKGYQRTEERAVLDRLAGSGCLAVVARLGWIFVEREIRGPKVSQLLHRAPRRCGRMFGRVLSELHQRSVVYNDALAPHVFIEHDEPIVVDLGLASGSDPLENDYIQVFVQVLPRIETDGARDKFLSGFCREYCYADRFMQMRTWSEREQLTVEGIFSAFRQGNPVVLPDYINLSADGYFGPLLE